MMLLIQHSQSAVAALSVGSVLSSEAGLLDLLPGL